MLYAVIFHSVCSSNHYVSGSKLYTLHTADNICNINTKVITATSKDDMIGKWLINSKPLFKF